MQSPDPQALRSPRATDSKPLARPASALTIIRNYWQAVKEVFAQEWGKPKQYLLLKNIGVFSLSLLGGAIIDRSMAQSRVDVPDMARYLRQTTNVFDWSKDAQGATAISGMSGNRAALLIAGALAKELTDDAGSSLKDLQERLKAQMAQA